MSSVIPSSKGFIGDFVAPVCHEFIEILYQDDDILLINKPSDLMSVSGRNPLNWDSVYNRLLLGQEGVTPAFPTAKLPHRLDLGTSGVMVVGLNEESIRHLNKQFQARKIKKRYIAMLEGWLADDQGQITGAITKDKTLFPRVKICDETGKEAISEYVVLQRLDQPRRSLVQFTPITGRTHQLRIHSLKISHPIFIYNLHDVFEKPATMIVHASSISRI